MNNSCILAIIPMIVTSNILVDYKIYYFFITSLAAKSRNLQPTYMYTIILLVTKHILTTLAETPPPAYQHLDDGSTIGALDSPVASSYSGGMNCKDFSIVALVDIWQT